MLVKRLVRSYRRSFVLKLSHGATTNIELLLSYVVLRVGQMSYTASKTTSRIALGLVSIKRLVRLYRCSFVLKLSHGATTNIELLLSYVVLRVGQMSYTA